MEDLLKSRRIIKTKIIRIEKHNESLDNPDKHRIRLHLEQLEEIWTRCNEIYEDIVQLEDDEESLENEKEFLALLDRIEVLKVKLMVGLTSSIAQETSEKHPQQVKLPKIDLPTFHGDLQDWQSFQDLFCVSVHNNPQLSGALKLQYLKSSLKGEAGSMVQAISVTDDNYQKAWDLLCGRYENEAEITFSHLDRLFSQPVMASENYFGLRKLLDTTYQCVESLKNLNHIVENWDVLLVYWIRKKLDADTLKAWELSNPRSTIGTFQDIKDFLEHRAKALAAIDSKKIKQPSVQRASNAAVTYSHLTGISDRAMMNLDRTVHRCSFCSAAHRIHKCPRYKELKPIDRKNWAMENKRCLNCLRGNHFVGHCKNSGRCHRCQKKHHSLLHFGDDDPSTAVASHNSKCRLTSYRTLIPTLQVKVCDREGNMQVCRALLDSGSQSSFIREDFLQRLGLQSFGHTKAIAGVLSKKVGFSKGPVQITVKSMHDPKIGIDLQALVVPTITADIPQRQIENLDLKSFKNLALADTTFAKPGAIDILLGADVWSKILEPGQLKSDKTSLIAQATIFGWIISGQAPVSAKGDTTSNGHHSVITPFMEPYAEFYSSRPNHRHRFKQNKRCFAKIGKSTNSSGDYGSGFPEALKEIKIPPFSWPYRNITKLEESPVHTSS